MMAAHDALSAWENFYIIVGSSAGALTGLQFVVMALVSDSGARTSTGEVDAFATPTIVHFCVVLLVSAILSAPWPELWEAAAAIGICGILGVFYTLIVIHRARRTTNYKAVAEDWIFHIVLPMIAYVTLLVSAAALQFQQLPALFGVAAFELLLLFVGIRNAWDTVTYITVGIKETAPPTDRGSPRPPS